MTSVKLDDNCNIIKDTKIRKHYTFHLTAGNALWGNVVPVLSVTFATLWILPFYLLSKVSQYFLNFVGCCFTAETGFLIFAFRFLTGLS